MLTFLLITVLFVALSTLVWCMWQVRRTLQSFVKAQENLQQHPALVQDLSQQVSELRQTMGGMVKGLRVMGSQVNNLNTLAGYALKTAQAHLDEESHPGQQIMIELHRSGQGDDDDGTSQVIHPDDMTPEMLEKFRTFQAIYRSIMDAPDIPSRQRPDLN